MILCSVFGSLMATIWERVVHSVYHFFFLYHVILLISHFSFEDETLVLNGSVAGHCFALRKHAHAIYSDFSRL